MSRFCLVYIGVVGGCAWTLTACGLTPASSSPAAIAAVNALYQTVGKIPAAARSASFQVSGTVAGSATAKLGRLLIGKVTVTNSSTGALVVNDAPSILSLGGAAANATSGASLQTPVLTFLGEAMLNEEPLSDQGANDLSLDDSGQLVYQEGLDNSRLYTRNNPMPADLRAACLAPDAPLVFPDSSPGADQVELDPNDPLVTAFRGIGSNSPGIDSARQGITAGRDLNSTMDPEQHIYSPDSSRQTSWTLSPQIAWEYASKDGPGGVILKVCSPQSSFYAPYNRTSGVNSGSQQVLLPGVIRRAAVYPVNRVQVQPRFLAPRIY